MAVDQNGAPVIIEYKRNQNENIITQALWYLSWLKLQKVEFFEMLIFKKLGKEEADKITVDWLNPRIICIAENYNKYDIHVLGEIKARVELFKYRYYENGILNLEPLNNINQTLEKSLKSKPTILAPTINLEEDKSSIKASPNVQAIFEEIQSRTLQFDENIIEKKNTTNTVYRIAKNFLEITPYKDKLRLLLRPVIYIDPLNKIEVVPESYKWSLNRRIYINHLEEVDYAMKLVHQSYQDIL